MEFMQTSPITEKYECLYCSQKYPSERDLSIHEYIHGNCMREAIFNLAIQPRNSYLIYEDFHFVCGRMKSGIMFKELGSAETPEQERIESPDKKEFEKSSSNNLPYRHLTLPEYKERFPNKNQFDKSSDNQQNSYHLTSPQFYNKTPNKKESHTSSNNLSCRCLTPPHHHEEASYWSESPTDLFAYKTFEEVYSMESAEDVEILKVLTENLLVKYGTFPIGNSIKSRRNLADRYKTSLISEANGRAEPPIAFSPGIRF